MATCICNLCLGALSHNAGNAALDALTDLFWCTRVKSLLVSHDGQDVRHLSDLAEKRESSVEVGCREGEITSTVVGRVEPHNLRLVHPHQDRTISMRENARAQVSLLILPVCNRILPCLSLRNKIIIKEDPT